MLFKNIITFCLILVSLLYTALTAEDLKCSPESDERADQEFSKLILFSDPDIKLPENDSKTKEFCA